MKTNTKTRKNALLNAMQTKNTTTHNGAVSHSSTGTALLDFFGKGGSMRSQTDDAAITLFRDAYKEDKTIALKILFYLADVRQGQGERKLFRNCFNYLAKHNKVVARNLIKYIPEYTRWDNVLESLMGTSLETEALDAVAAQLVADAKSTDKVSLCAKWAPSEQASSATTKALAKKLRTNMGATPRQYRKLLSYLRKKIDVVERKMCAGDWNEINYQNLPSRASSLYRKAFNKHDGTRYSGFLTKVEKGEAKINAATLYPYDIVRAVRSFYNVDRTLEAQWKALPDYLKDNPHNGIVVADVSASMDSSGYYGGKTDNVAPIDVAVSLAIYFAERNEGAFSDNFMIFSNNAKLLNIGTGSLQSKVRQVLGDREIASTNLQAVFDLILDKALKYKVPESEMPSHLYIVSDMQFDQATSDYGYYSNNKSKTNFEVIKSKYARAGYKMPQIVFWNVNSYSDVPVKFDDKGVCLVSGCSPSILKSVLSGKVTTPYDMMINTVCTERYAPIVAE